MTSFWRGEAKQLLICSHLDRAFVKAAWSWARQFRVRHGEHDVQVFVRLVWGQKGDCLPRYADAAVAYPLRQAVCELLGGHATGCVFGGSRCAVQDARGGTLGDVGFHQGEAQESVDFWLASACPPRPAPLL
jgi:hypothetical protein